MLWHGSNQHIEGQLVPHKSFHYKPYVYATSDPYYAIVRCGKFDIDKFLLKEDYNGEIYTLIELEENAIEKVFNTNGYLYAVSDDTFVHTEDCMPNEYISTESRNIVDTLHINNVASYIDYYKNHYKVIKYGSEEEKEYWKTVRGGRDGYLQRRQERVEKLRGKSNE